MALYRKTRISTLINIVGMSIAFAAAIILTVQVKWDVTYDDNFDGSERVFKYESKLLDNNHFATHISRPLIETLRTASPNIEAIGTFWPLESHNFHHALNFESRLFRFLISQLLL